VESQALGRESAAMRCINVVTTALISLLIGALPVACTGEEEEARPLEVWGYVPEYRFDAIDWSFAMNYTTHLVLFSLEPLADGSLNSEDIVNTLRSSSPLTKALKAAGARAPKLLVTLGGLGRSQHFPAVMSSSKARKALVGSLKALFEQFTVLSGVDVDWQRPETAQQFREIGKFAKELRKVLSQQISKPILSTTYHPRSGAEQVFASLRGEKAGSDFLSKFDCFHALTYSMFDGDRRHSTSAMDDSAVDEWKTAGLPSNRLSLGIPFFGIHRATSQARSYAEIVVQEASLTIRPSADEASDGTYFINARSLTKKVAYARQQGLRAVTVWELGQDLTGDPINALLTPLWRAARHGELVGSGLYEAIAGPLYHDLSEDHFFGILACILAAYYIVKVFTYTHARDLLQPPPKVKKTTVWMAAGQEKPAENAAPGGQPAANGRCKHEEEEVAD